MLHDHSQERTELGSSHTQEHYKRGRAVERLCFAHHGQERQQRSNVLLRWMFAYSSALCMIVIRGLHQAAQDESFLGETTCEIGPHRDGAALAELGKLSKELILDHAETMAHAAVLICYHTGCDAKLCLIAQTSGVEPPPLGRTVGEKTWQL